MGGGGTQANEINGPAYKIYPFKINKITIIVKGKKSYEKRMRTRIFKIDKFDSEPSLRNRSIIFCN